MRKLFGTDGIRGKAGEYPLDENSIFTIGHALGHHLHRKHGPARVIIGQDTRESSPWIADRLARGLLSRGAEVVSAGVITTPGIAYLARTGDFAAGIVISASHNPWQDNGIKVFAHDGYKLPDEVELSIEHEIFRHAEKALAVEPPAQEFRSLPGEAQPRKEYERWLARQAGDADLSRLNVMVDCANGAASVIAPDVFHACGIDATFIHSEPDGRNINDHCGALHPEVVAEAVREGNSYSATPRYALGITFDGDADRALFCNSDGRIIDGDAVLLLAARSMKNRGALTNNLVVATTMSNMGLEIALKRSGIRMLRANVGDKYVLEEMRKTGATLGGEQSGHIIFRDGDATTGDGLLTSLRVMAKMASSHEGLNELIGDLKVFPQTIKNVRVREKKPLLEIDEVAKTIRVAEGELDGCGRLVVRYSGTESLARVMVEAESEEQMRRVADTVAAAIERNLGV